MKTLTLRGVWLLVILALGPGAWPSTLPAQPAPADGALLGERPYTFPPYEQAYGYTRIDGTQDAIEKYWSKDEYDAAISDTRFEFRKLIYSSNGLRVEAYVNKPRRTDVALPTIVFNRGSGVHKDIAPVLIPYFHRLAEEGFVVIAPMYRQSDGGDGCDANGGDDLHDLLNVLPLIESLPYADAGDIFMTGESRGAMMVYQAIREGFPMRAAAVWGGFTDLGLLMRASPELSAYAAEHWPGFDAEDPDADIERRSAIRWPERINVPILLMHGERDGSVPVEHTYVLARELQRLNRLYGLMVFADDDHILSRSQVERDRASVMWFRRFSSQAEAEMIEFLRTTASERDVTRRGYSLLARGRLDDAIAIFRLNVERFPGSSNAHDSLGEALAMSGDTAGARDSYQRALRLATEESEKERIRRVIESLGTGP
jgi:dienelactone hydrolase